MAYGMDGNQGVYTSYGRQAQLRAVFEWLNHKPLPVVVEHEADLWVMIRRNLNQKQVVIMAANQSFDTLRKFALAVGNLAAGEWNTARLQPNGTLLPLGRQRVAGAKAIFQFAGRVEPQEVAVLVLERVA